MSVDTMLPEDHRALCASITGKEDDLRAARVEFASSFLGGKDADCSTVSDTKAQISKLEVELAELQAKYNSAVIVSEADPNVVSIGTVVTVQESGEGEDRRYRIGGSFVSTSLDRLDPEGAFRISARTARAELLLGAKVGERRSGIVRPKDRRPTHCKVVAIAAAA